MLGVNPFNQPGVENYKGYMFEGLENINTGVSVMEKIKVGIVGIGYTVGIATIM